MHEISIPLLKEEVSLQGILTLPIDSQGIILFVHGSGSGRFSPRNQAIAKHFVKEGMGTLLFDLLTKDEEAIDDITHELRFNVRFLAKRLIEVTKWVQSNAETKMLRIGYFGSSTGAAAALLAAENIKDIAAIVSRGGRPDLAQTSLTKIYTPTLLIVGGYDYEVIELNQLAFNLLKGEKKMEIVPRATHLFEEPGALEEVQKLAARWFKEYLI